MNEGERNDRQEDGNGSEERKEEGDREETVKKGRTGEGMRDEG